MPLGGTCNGVIAREHDLAHGGTGAGVKATCERLVLLGGVELRVQELVELRGVDAAHGLLTGDEAFLDNLDSDAQGGGCRTLAYAGLEHPELALLDGELDVAHVAVVILERQEDTLKLLTCGLEARGGLEVGDGLGVADAGNDVLALGVDQKVTVELLGAVGRVARKGDTGRRGLALIAKGHSLNVDGGAKVVGNAVLFAVDAGALVHPATKDGLDSKAQLEFRIMWEDRLAVGDFELGVQGSLDVLRENALESIDELLQILGRKLGVDANAGDGTGIVVAQAAIANLRNNVDGRNQAKQPHRVYLVNRLGRLHTVRQRNVGDLVALIGQIHRQRRLGCARHAQQHDIGTRQIVATASVIVLDKVLHGLDAVEIPVIGLMDHTRHSFWRHADKRRQHRKRRADQVDRANVQHAQVVEHAGAKRRVDDSVEHGDIAMVGIDARTHKRLDLLH